MSVIARMFMTAGLLAGLCAPAATAQLVFDGAVMDRAGLVERAGVSALRVTSDGGEATTIDPRGTARTRPAADLIALVPRTWADGGAPTLTIQPDAWDIAGGAFLELADGERFVGRPGSVSAEGESIAWVHERFGTITLPLDAVAGFVLRPGVEVAGLSADVKADTLWLVNGDRLEGFLEAIGPRDGGEGFTLTLESGGSRVSVPVDQVVRARLANPRRAAQGPMVWLSDGSVIAATTIASEGQGQGVRITPAAVRTNTQPKGPDSESTEIAGSAVFGADEINAIAFDASRLAPLAGLEVVSYRPIGLPRRPGPRVIETEVLPAPLGAADVILPGPMEVEWALPAGAQRIVGNARLDEPDWAWGECEVTIEIISGNAPREIARTRLDGATSSSPIAADLGAPAKAGDRLRVRIEPGERGPIRDRVRLERVIVLR